MTSFLIFSIRHSLGRDAVREESIGNNLGSLPPRHVVPWPEVWPALRVARLSHPSAWIPAHYSSGGETHYLDIEGVVGRDIRIELPCDGVLYLGSIGYYLG